MSADALGTLAKSASVVKLSCGPDCVVAIGLCGRLRAWKKPAPRVRLMLTVRPGSVGASVKVDTVGADAPWTLVLSDSSMYELANNRRTSHPYIHLSAISPAGRFVAATIETTSTLRVFDTTTWTRAQTLEPVADEGERDEWSKRGLKSVRASPSCLQLAHGHLACGTREGMIRLWRADGKSYFTRRHGNLLADKGPVAAVVLTPEMLVAAYRQVTGFCDGNAYIGEQSTVAWSLSTGCLLWCIQGPAMPRAPPVLGAVCCAEQLVLLHADTLDADAEWNLVRPPAPEAGPDAAAAESSLLIRSLPLGASSIAAAGGPQARRLDNTDVKSLSRAAVGAGSSRLLAWHSDGDALGLGFAAGAVTLALKGVVEGGAPYALGAARSASAADVAHVVVVPPGLLGACDGKVAEDVFAAAMLAADAAGHVRGWALRLDALAEAAAPAKLGLVALFELAISPARQPSSLGIVGRTLVCGCADGTLHAKALPALTLSARNGAATVAMSSGSSRVEDTSAEVLESPSEGVRTEYEWLFDTGAGAQARGRLSEKRRFFDGWARSGAYELGLQAVLAKMQGQTGNTKPSSAPAMPASATSAAAAALAAGMPTPESTRAQAGWARGTRVRLHGLAARPELNGAIGLLLGELEAESGRAPVKLMAPPEHAGKTLKAKPANLLRLP